VRINNNVNSKYSMVDSIYDFNEGHESGKIEGKIEGERNRNIEIAKSMLNKNYSFDEITELTGLSEEEIEELKEK